mmetsp:Transcript_28643/g.37537  ORF Transcript_28643/g.37537 Transcript_28643/m.37537 type:complete len:424 (-) Transcript_28643:254-1525(-)|eukprot:CAMPEP_0117749364 /NCGR_PEP_ID=MMETSP0947-20121206/9689_1 /TAXON_ID=44440 /ORGANISM="Chattonella subsalsa, Strain CCMP2191" /LENGTH=423 /DNA_ID=CAMNT_0005567247 /DNA_START=127 /DNA_END=1398 /DNA_ORIENTATION=+
MEVVEEGSEEGTYLTYDDQSGMHSQDENGHIEFYNEGEEVVEQNGNQQFQAEHPEAEATSISARFPQINTPLRVEAPAQIKAPPRIEPKNKEQSIKETAFSPQAYIKRLHEVMPLIQADNPHVLPDLNPRIYEYIAGKKTDTKDRQWGEMEASYRVQIRDLSTLASSSRRGGRIETEALAHYSLGVLYDNIGMLNKAIDSYLSYLDTTKRLRDPVQEALALNCLGVNCMHLAMGEDTSFGEVEVSQSTQDLIRQALDYHNSHLMITDEGGSCVAHTNLGLCHSALGSHAEAAKHHQEALRMALKTQSLGAQALAVGNLGLLAMRQGDAETARACLEQHLQLVQGLRDVAAEVNAWTQMGNLATIQNDHGEAARCFGKAADICEINGEISTLKRLNCMIGIARGNMQMEAFMAERKEQASKICL